MGEKPTWDQVITAIMGDCIEHEHERVGRCVYCTPCGRRLYQGTVMSARERAAQKQALAEVATAREAGDG
jgi:hypothetical protein